MAKNTNSVFAKNLIRLMDENEVTVEFVAKYCGTSKSNIVSWRSGVSPTNFEAVRKLTSLFNVSFSFLLTGKEDEISTKTPSVNEAFEEGDILFDGYAKISIQRLIPKDKKER